MGSRGACSRCGRMMEINRGSLPPNERTCRECRRQSPGPYHPNGDKALEVGAGLSRNCAICSTEFVAVRFFQRFCSEGCRSKNHRQTNSRRRAREQARLAARPSTARRGYGVRHTRLRAEWAPKVDAGQVSCWRCGAWIEPGTPWDLGHDDYDRSKYKGPEHARCNRGAPKRRSRQTARQSRVW
jgi:hypothetical protein